MNKEELDKHRRLLIELCKEKDNEISILQARIDKAIFYMKDDMINEPFTMYKVDQIDVRKLLQILQGEDK